MIATARPPCTHPPCGRVRTGAQLAAATAPTTQLVRPAPAAHRSQQRRGALYAPLSRLSAERPAPCSLLAAAATAPVTVTVRCACIVLVERCLSAFGSAAEAQKPRPSSANAQQPTDSFEPRGATEFWRQHQPRPRACGPGPGPTKVCTENGSAARCCCYYARERLKQHQQGEPQSCLPELIPNESRGR